VRVLVVGAIHGNEPAGTAVVAALRRARPPAGTALWLIEDLNPDGAAHGTRQNARGVDLNRNWPDAWRAGGRPFDVYYGGRRPLSEPEALRAARFIRRLRPAVTVWYHQALRLVDTGTVADARIPRRYARATGLPARRLGFLPGVATRWQNHLLPGSSAFVVELPSGRLSRAAARRHARAVVSLLPLVRQSRAAGRLDVRRARRRRVPGRREEDRGDGAPEGVEPAGGGGEADRAGEREGRAAEDRERRGGGDRALRMGQERAGRSG
jgi:protein MpaA